LPNKPIFGLPRDHFKSSPMDTVGLIPMSWWCYRMTDKELLDNPPQIYCGGEFREKSLNNIFYGNMHGEDIVTKSNDSWIRDFIHRFATYQVPCHFLNTQKRLAIYGKGMNKYCEFSNGIVSYAKGRKITKNGKIIKDGDTLFLPFVHKESTYIAYSKNGDCRDWDITETDKAIAEIYRITENGNELIREIPIKNNKLHINIPEQIAYLVILK
ncbi:hypothetical protein, partial [Eubacterium sp.]|uniref:hypothetical protein n=1 Tax=Eubacterium sp. TaxID=142586 RepID=UPI003F03B0A3